MRALDPMVQKVKAVTKLHYIYDPLCGWCYAAAPLVAAARGILPVEGHAGGMMAGPNRKDCRKW